jgi:hypothetical protein
MTIGSHSKAQWTHWKPVEGWEASGQSRRACCPAHKLDYFRFGYLRKKFRRATSDEATRRTFNAFVPVIPHATD